MPGAAAHRSHAPRLTPDGGAALDPAALMNHVAAVIGEALLGLPGEAISAVGLSTFWHGLVATGPDLRPLTPVLLWSDGRSWREAQLLREQMDERALHRRTGCRLHPSYWPAKILWLRRRDRRLRAQGVRWHSPADLVYHHLFGEVATSSSLASGTGLRLLRRDGWDVPLLGRLGIGVDSLPAVSDEPRRALTARWRRRWPQLAEAVWAPPAGDGALANVGSGCLDARRRALTIGTSGALRALTGRAPARLPPSLWCYRLDGGRFVVGGALSNGGNLHAWLEQVLSHPDRKAVTTEHGLTFLPLLAGERGPGYALRATGAIAGLTAATTAADIMEAGLEAVAVDFARLDRDLDRVLPRPELLVASGAGLLANPDWMRMLADATGRPVASGDAREASARGAAYMAFEAAGVLTEADLARLDPGVGARAEPDPGARRHYDDAARRREALYRVLIEGHLLEKAGAHAPAHARRPRGAR